MAEFWHKGKRKIFIKMSLTLRLNNVKHSQRNEPLASRLAIVELIQIGINMSAPTLGHFLLGFDIMNVSQSQLQNPNIAGIRTPFHSILGLLTPQEPGVPSALLYRQVATLYFYISQK